MIQCRLQVAAMLSATFATEAGVEFFHPHMFGFPQTLEEFGLKHYIRLCAIICGYLVIRPYIDRLYARLGEKDRLKALKKQQEEDARAHKEHRIKEKLGLSVDEPLPEDVKAAQASASATTSGTSEGQSVPKMLRRKPKSEQQKLKQVYDDMFSDEDIGDLITRVDSSTEQ